MQFKYPAKRITVNRLQFTEEGGRFDLPIASLGILAASDQRCKPLKTFEFVAELAWQDNCVAYMVWFRYSCSTKIKRVEYHETMLMKPRSCLIEILICTNALDVVQFLNGQEELPATEIVKKVPGKKYIRFMDIIGQQHAKRALTIAAAGQHNLLFLITGYRKNHVNKPLTGLLPEMTLKR